MNFMEEREGIKYLIIGKLNIQGNCHYFKMKAFYFAIINLFIRQNLNLIIFLKLLIKILIYIDIATLLSE